MGDYRGAQRQGFAKGTHPGLCFSGGGFSLGARRFRGTVSQLLAAVGNTELKPNLASKHLTRHYSDVLLPLGITYEYRKTAAARLVLLELHDGADGYDGSSGSERLVSLRKQNDGTFRLPKHRHKRHLRHGRRRRTMRNCRFRGAGAIHRFLSVRITSMGFV